MYAAPTDSGSRLTTFRRYTWWAVPGTLAVVLVVLAGGQLLDPRLPLAARATGIAALVVVLVTGVVLLGRRLTTRPVKADDTRWWLAAGTAGAAVLAMIALAFREYGVWAVAPAVMVAVAATLLTSGPRRVLVAVAAVGAAAPGTIVGLASGEPDLLYPAVFPVGLVLFTVWVTLGPLWAWDVAGELDRARRLSATLAIQEERLRFSADLHDIQGHHLQVIALKSELAARLALSDPARAASQMEEVRQLSHDALRDTRALVQGYRRTSLEEEIANATRILASADIDARMTVDPDAGSLPAPGRHLLGLVMREAVTNVLRHSSASRTDVSYRIDGGTARLRVTNNGATDRSTDDGATDGGAGDRPAPTPGTGLSTLAGRLAAAGGELTWRRRGDDFVVAATLPLDGAGA